MIGLNRCGHCDNCLKLAEVQQSVLKACNPPFSHADDDLVKVWNDAARDYPCTGKDNETQPEAVR